MKQTISESCATIVLIALLLLPGCGARDAATGKRDAGVWMDDKTITLSIERDFLEDDQIRFTDFNAYSYGGHVYLVGLYTLPEQVDRAVKIAKSYKGVRKVSTYFLHKGMGMQCNAAERLEIGTTARHKYVADKALWSSDITVEILQCTIVLLGYVDTDEQKNMAEDYARSIHGVDKVKSFLTVR
jgi:hyperosmotically inducible protein